MLTLNANAEPVFLTYRPSAGHRRADVAAAAKAPPLYDFTGARRGAAHGVAGGRRRPRWLRHFADGAAGLRGRRAPPLGQRLARGPGAARGEPAPYRRRGVQLVPRGALPVRPAPILPYNRVVRDLNGLTPDAVARAARRRSGASSAATDPTPGAPGSFGVYPRRARGSSSTLDPASIDRGDPIGSLDVSLLQDRVLGPILGIGDPRTDKRIDFVGGIRGAGGAGAPGGHAARWRSASRMYPDHDGPAAWRCPTRARSCRPRAPGSSPSCAADCSFTSWS